MGSTAVVPHLLHCFCDLYPPHLARGLHPARHVDRVAPDVVLRLPGPHHPGNNRTSGSANSQLENLETFENSAHCDCY